VRLQFGTSKEPKFIPADEIERVEVKLTPDQQEGEKLYEQKDYRAAVEKLEAALKVESRPWLLARLGSEIVSSYVALGDSVAAIEAFFAASQATEGQINWTAVPVWWLPEPPGGQVTPHALSLLRSNSPMQQVIGASYLFGTEHSATARDTIAKLTTYRDERVGQLARTQLWRWDAANASPEDVASWQRQANKLPGDFRGGPYFVIGVALKRLGQHEDAALAFLWPAWVYHTDPRLSARAALLAAESLAQAGQRAEARQVYEELIARYSRSTEATTAQERLNAFKE
jgi:tetratricopeptide (TPR) repeat protein